MGARREESPPEKTRGEEQEEAEEEEKQLQKSRGVSLLFLICITCARVRARQSVCGYGELCAVRDDEFAPMIHPDSARWSHFGTLGISAARKVEMVGSEKSRVRRPQYCRNSNNGALVQNEYVNAALDVAGGHIWAGFLKLHCMPASSTLPT